MSRFVCLLTVQFLTNFVITAAEPTGLSVEQRRERIKTLRAMIASLETQVGPKIDAQPLKLAAEPSLLYADNERELSDASLWVWEHEGRPAALFAMEFRLRDGVNGLWTFESASLTSQPLRIRLPDEAWDVPADAVTRTILPDAPAPAIARGQRLLQFRKLADRFSAIAHSTNQGRIELRRLAAPVYRQAESVPGDGAIFVFANGTNPEVVLSLQADLAAQTWSYVFGTLSGDATSANLDDREVYRVERFTGPGTRVSYTNGKMRVLPTAGRSPE